MKEIEKQIQDLRNIKEDLIKKHKEKALVYDMQDEIDEKIEAYLDEYEGYIATIDDMIKELIFINQRIENNKEIIK